MSRKELKKISVLFLCLVLLLTGCIKDTSDEDQAKHDNELKVLLDKYGMTDADMIEEGIWVKFDNSEEVSPTVLPAAEDYVVVDVLGTYASGEIFDISDSAVATANEVYRSDLVYGPIRLKLDNTFYGFYTVLQKLGKGSRAKMVLSQENAFGGYTPIAYEVKLHNVFSDINKYFWTDYNSYRDSLGFSLDDTLATDGTVYTKTLIKGTDSLDIQLGDSVFMKLHAYYAETDPTFVDGNPGRQYFPINELGSEIEVNTGIENFPYVPNLMVILKDMTLGEKRLVLMPPNYVYGSTGYRHPFVGKYIVLPYTGVHFEIEVDSVRHYQ